ncbi:putative membrane protein YeaQ/YmgE (transglycosylase-associated protein family) [Cupriavidus metallidurans]
MTRRKRMLGLAVVGAVVGLAGRQMHPSGRVVSLPAALLLGAAGALAAFYTGRAAHLFTDGQLLGWGAAIIGAAVLVGVWGVARPRR